MSPWQESLTSTDCLYAAAVSCSSLGEWYLPCFTPKATRSTDVLWRNCLPGAGNKAQPCTVDCTIQFTKNSHTISNLSLFRTSPAQPCLNLEGQFQYEGLRAQCGLRQDVLPRAQARAIEWMYTHTQAMRPKSHICKESGGRGGQIITIRGERGTRWD